MARNAGAFVGDGTANIDNSLNTQEANTWTLAIKPASADFMSTDMDQLMAPRKADGSLPDINFLRPAPESDIIDAGVDIGFGFLGNAPDLGAIEFDPATAIKDYGQPVPKKINLRQNYPNPFNPNTTIRYTLAEPGSVTLAVYNFLGQQVRILDKRYRPAGEFSVSWNGDNDQGDLLASGIYFYRLAVSNAAGSGISQKKMILLK